MTATGPRRPRTATAPEDAPLADLLAVVAGTDRVRELASRYAVGDLAARSEAELRGDGLPPTAALRLASAFEVLRRVRSETRCRRGEPIRSSAEIYAAFAPRLRGAVVEHFYIVTLDAKCRTQREIHVSTGTLTSSLVHPREVFRLAMRDAAHSIVLVHNHPSGDPEPSEEDQDLTKRLCAVGELVGIRVADHVVIGDGHFVSFAERQWITP